MPPSNRDPASVRLVEIAAEIAMAGGPAALTARTLAARAEASPSAANYHFGGRAGLLQAVHGVLRERREAWRGRRLAELDGARGSPVWAFMVAAVFDLAFTRREECLALLEFAALGGSEPLGLADAVRQEHFAQERFWREAAERLGAPPEEGLVWANLAHTVTRFALVDEAPMTALTWLSPAMLRVAERLAGHATPAATPWLAAAEQPGTLPTRTTGAQRLVDAALQIIGQRGLQAVTLRNVAEAAGLSLASTTYFFETKAEIVQAAFAQLRDGVSVAALGAGQRGATGFSQALLSAEGAMRWEIAAIQALFLAGARNADLRPVALSLRRLSGQTASAWLAVHASQSCDRLDAFVWSCFGMGLQEQLAFLDPGQRKAAMDAATERAGAALFGIVS